VRIAEIRTLIGVTTTEASTVVRGRRAWVTLLAWVVLGTLLWAGLCNLVLDLSTVPFRPVHHWGESIVSTGLLWVAILALVCVTNRLWLSFAVSLVLCSVVAATSLAKHAVRDEPLYPSDLYFLWQPSFLLDMAPPWALAGAALAVIALVVGLVLVGRWFDGRHFPRVRRSEEPRAWSRLLALRVVVALGAILALLTVPQFNAPENRIRGIYEAAGAQWLSWRQADNYSENGFVAGFLFNTYAGAMEEPAGYGRATMEEIARRYATRAEERNGGRTSGALAATNVVLLLSEAFSDPERLDGVNLEEDPIPFVRATMAENPSGQAIANGVGGGTANMEFEALTGMSQTMFTPQLTTPYQMLVPAYDWMPSAAWYFADHGHEAIAVHPFLESMYRRSTAYPRLGFDSFLGFDDLSGLSEIEKNPFASDATTFDEALRLLTSSDEPLFMNLVTMQNHFPYDGLYGDPVENSLRSDKVGQYARGLAHADAATEKLFAGLKQADEETLVIFYGDHLPGDVYEGEVIEQNFVRRTETPFFLWSSHRDLPATRLPATSPNFFLPLAFDAADAPLPPYYALLLDLHAEVPNLSLSRPVDPSTLSDRARALLHDLRLVQYDFSVGKRYVTGEMFHPPP
jgi:phosphoglycerol transferase MdoB-like AlkP superfamily enzyme